MTIDKISTSPDKISETIIKQNRGRKPKKNVY